jgi:hypothetical protein
LFVSFVLFVVFVVQFSSCGKEAPAMVEVVPAETVAVPAERKAVLESGNNWTRGIPGFGENALSALAGEYRVEAWDGAAHFSVWLTREVLYYSGWQASPLSAENVAMREKDEDGNLVAAVFNGVWTAVFRFSGDDLSADDRGRIVLQFRARFLYFLTLAFRDSDISLPATVEL